MKRDPLTLTSEREPYFGVGGPNKRNGSPKFLVSQIEDLEYVRYQNHKPN